jgi:cation transport ATPase
VSHLKQLGLTVWLLSGDGPGAVEHVARELGIGMAAIGMSASLLVVVFNALRLGYGHLSRDKTALS